MEASQALEGFHARYSSGEPTTHFHQLIDANQINLTRLTLSPLIPLNNESESLYTASSPSANGRGTGGLLIPSEHLSFFTPRVGVDQLGRDGSDMSFNPPGGVFTRRMWAGGDMSFEKGNSLCVGDQAWEKTTVEKAECKQLKSKKTDEGEAKGEKGRGEMIVVWVKKEIGNERGLCLVDRRSWIFQPALKGDQSAIPPSSAGRGEASETDVAIPSTVSPQSSKLILDPTALFRYSALTFNAHAIHISPPWAQQVEGHQNVVVHGPLNLSLILRKWGQQVGGWSIDEQGRFTDKPGKNVKRIQYRAKKPLYANEPYFIGLSTNENDGGKVLAVKANGQVAMEADITAW